MRGLNKSLGAWESHTTVGHRKGEGILVGCGMYATRDSTTWTHASLRSYGRMRFTRPQKYFQAGPGPRSKVTAPRCNARAGILAAKLRENNTSIKIEDSQWDLGLAPQGLVGGDVRLGQKLCGLPHVRALGVVLPLGARERKSVQRGVCGGGARRTRTR